MSRILIPRILRSFPFVFVGFFVDLTGVFGTISSSQVEQHLLQGKQLLASGQLNDALMHYHAAVEGDPQNFLTYFKRATVYIALGRSKSALPDLDKVIELKPDFYQARLQRGNMLLKQGRLDEAHIDYESVLRQSPGNADAVTQLGVIEPIKRDIMEGKFAMERGDYQTAIEHLSRSIDVCPWDHELRILRADCYEGLGNFINAISDIKPTTKLIRDNTGAYLRLSKLHYQLGELEDALREIRECLKLDPDHKECFPFYKKQKKLLKQLNGAQDLINRDEFHEAISKLKKALKTESKVKPFVGKARRQMCKCHLNVGEANDAIRECNKALDVDPDDVDALCDRAEAHLLNENYDEAVSDYQKAKNINGNLNKVQEGLEKALRLQKQSKKKDYYKILGIKRSATKREITKAYRKLAMKWHPDQYKGEERKQAEKRFIDIAHAKEVLSDPEKRAKFDNGEDPLDPEQQQGGNPWQQGGFPFGEGFQFKFHFN